MKQYTNIFEGSFFPDDPYKIVKVTLNQYILNEYIPAFKKALPEVSKGLQLLAISMCHQEGFRPGTRSYKYNNPGNLGNTDSGANKGFPTLEDGIKAQADHLIKIAEGKEKNYPIGKELHIAPYYSPEIAKNEKNYGIPAHLPGYHFIYTGQLDQFIKIYSTGARASNSYLNTIVSLFTKNGLTISPTNTIKEIIDLT